MLNKLVKRFFASLNNVLLWLISAVSFLGLFPLVLYLLYFVFYDFQIFRVIGGSLAMVVFIYVNKAVQGGTR